MSLALYRKYRPRTFAEVIGQQHVTEPLAQALRSGRLHHAYLFSGPRGCGKTSSARILARSLNCVKGPTPEPCGECESCVALAPDGPGSIDVIEIDAASHGGVDDARDLRERAFFAPAASRFKVYVIDEAHMVSPQGFNALLKLVEEPPEFVKFVFATTEPEKVLGTIRSRTHHYPFRLIPPSVLRPYLEKLCREEGVSVEAAVFPLVVRAGGGSARDSLSVLDQLIAGAGVYGVTYARAVSLLGVTDVALIDEMTDALAAGDGATAFATIDRVADAGHDSRRFASDLLERLRDLIIVQRVPDAAAKGIIEAPEDQLERMTAQAARMGPATLSRLADIAHNGLTEMRGTTAPRLLLELIIARMLLPGADDTHGALLQRLERMERRLGVASAPGAGEDVPPEASPPAPAPSAPARPAPAPSAPARPAPARTRARSAEPAEPRADPSPPAPTGSPAVTPATPPAVTPAGSPAAAEAVADAGLADKAGSLDAAAVRRVWDEILSMVRRRSPRAWAVVREAMVRDVHGDEIVLVFQHGVHANMFGAQAELLIDAVREVLGGAWRVRAELGGDQGRGDQARGDQARGDQARGDQGQRGATGQPANPPAQPRAPARPASSSGTAAVAADDGGWPATAKLGGEDEGSATTSGALDASLPSAPVAAAPVGAAPVATGPGAPAPVAAGPVATKPSATERSSAPPVPVPPQPERSGPERSELDLAELDRSELEPLRGGRTVEEHAIRLLSEQLGAERVGDPPSS